MIITNRICITLLIAILTGFSQINFAREISDTIRYKSNKSDTADNKSMALCAMPTSLAILDINNVRATMLNGGDLWWNTTDAGYEVPKVNDPTQPAKHSLFAGAIWIGGVDPGGNLYVAAQRYRQSGQKSYWPGPLNVLDTITSDECLAWDRHFKINKDSIYVFRYKYQQGLIVSANDITDEVKFWPGKNNPYLLQSDTNFGATLNQGLASFIDLNFDGNYNPLDGDYPDIMGDQSVWWVINDAGDIKVGVEPENAAIGLEIQIEAFAFCASNALNNATFYSYKIINKGTITLNNTYIGQWVDPDLGQYDDDYVGCDVGRGMGYCYNGDDLDEGIHGYGQNPPAIGIDFVTGILADPNDSIDNDRDGIIDEAGEQIIMSNFLYYNNDADIINGGPDKGIHYYNYLRNIWKNGSLCVYDGGDGVEPYLPNPITNPVPTNFMFPGNTDPYGWGVGGSISNPVSMPVWTENTAGNIPADRRFIMSMGPVTLSPGSVNDFTIAVPWAKAASGGAFASVQKLQEADDVIQLMFDNNFVHYKGPAAPDVTIQSDSLEIILQLSPSPDYITILNGQPIQVNTTNYQEGNGSLIYTFQGYQVFQLAGQYVTLADLDDPDLALEVAQSDLADGIDTLSNLVWDFSSQSFIWQVMVNGDNTWLKNIVSITTDAFTGTSFIANKTYYYAVIAYASANPAVTDTSYIRGCNNFKVVSATRIYPWNNPDDPDYFNKGFAVKRITGTGNMGRVLELSNASVDSIITYNFVKEPIYKSRYAPVNISVIDDSLFTGIDFRLELSSYLEYANATGTFNVGDTIVCTEPYPFVAPTSTQDANIVNPFSYQSLQTPGEAVIKRIVLDNGTSGIFDIEVINQQKGGTFVMEFDSVRIFIDVNGDPIGVFIGYKTKPMPFSIKNSPADSAIAIDYIANDYWKLINININDTIFSQFRISEEIEEVISQYGISIQIKNSNNPNYRIKEDRNNGFQEATMELNPWLEGVKNDEVAWLMSSSAVDNNNGYDPGYIYRRVLDGSWAPYSVTRTVKDSGAAYFTLLPKNTLHFLNNVDVIITNDKSKWTRVPVLQISRLCGTSSSKDYLRLIKSYYNTSIDINGDPVNLISDYDSMPSTGMGWFPGYAIDLDKGIRLNMMFTESVESDTVVGNNLIWEPTTDIDGGRSYIYIMNSKYDEGKQLEYLYDSIIDAHLNNLSTCFFTFSFGMVARIKTDIFDNCLWVGNPRLAAGHTLLETDVKIRLRVNRAYQAYGMDTTNANNPVYLFGSGITTGIWEYDLPVTKTNKVMMYPNPTLNDVYFRINDKNKIKSFKLYDNKGRVVYSQSNINSSSLRIKRKGLSSGMYYYRIISENDKIFTGKLIFE